MSKFVGTFINKVDAKGRVSAPSDFRAALAGQDFLGVVCLPSITEAALDGGGVDMLEEIQAMIDELDPYADERDAFAMSFMGDARKLAFDADGRISLPAEFIAHADLNGRAVFVGMGDKFQIWNPELFESERARRREIAREHRGLLLARRKRGGSNNGGAA